MTEELLSKLGEGIDAIEEVMRDETTEKFIAKELKPIVKELSQIYDDNKAELMKKWLVTFDNGRQVCCGGFSKEQVAQQVAFGYDGFFTVEEAKND